MWLINGLICYSKGLFAATYQQCDVGIYSWMSSYMDEYI